MSDGGRGGIRTYNSVIGIHEQNQHDSSGFAGPESPDLSPILSPSLSRTGARLKKRPETLLSDIRAHGPVAYVTLTKGYVATIDVADIPLVWGYNWSALPHGNTVYAKAAQTVDGVRRAVVMHRLLLGFSHGDGREGDHRDGNGLNNRRNNLREATRTQQVHNRGSAGSTTSRYRGVFWVPKRGKWCAKCTIAGKRRYLGHFDSEEEASAVYEHVAKIIHGEFYRPPTAVAPNLGQIIQGALPPVVRALLAQIQA